MPKVKKYQGDPDTAYERYLMLKAEIDDTEPVISTNPNIKTWWDFVCDDKKNRKKKQ